jgi:hypothetical protein
MELRPAIAGRLLLEGATSLEPAELDRCFRECAAPEMLKRVSTALLSAGMMDWDKLSEYANGLR